MLRRRHKTVALSLMEAECSGQVRLQNGRSTEHKTYCLTIWPKPVDHKYYRQYSAIVVRLEDSRSVWRNGRSIISLPVSTYIQPTLFESIGLAIFLFISEISSGSDAVCCDCSSAIYLGTRLVYYCCCWCCPSQPFCCLGDDAVSDTVLLGSIWMQT